MYVRRHHRHSSHTNETYRLVCPDDPHLRYYKDHRRLHPPKEHLQQRANFQNHLLENLSTYLP